MNRSDLQTGSTATRCSAFVAQRGFTLTELAIVMFIVALLLGGMLLPLSAQQDVRARQETEKILANARDALVGFAISNDRLPCPAYYLDETHHSSGQESFCTTASGACTVTTIVQTHGRCSNPYDGFLPAAMLGITPIDTNGFALDGWGGETRKCLYCLRYAVTTNEPTLGSNYPPYQTDFASTSAAYAFTYSSGMKTVSLTSLRPDLKICSTGTGMQFQGLNTADCATTAVLASDAVAVIFSLGKNAGTGGSGIDENHNPNPQTTFTTPDRAFVSATQGTDFDDSLVWISKSILFNRMVTAGRLP